MNDEKWRGLLIAEHNKWFTRVSSRMRPQDFMAWAIGIGIDSGSIREIENGNRKTYETAPFQFEGRIVRTLDYVFYEVDGSRPPNVWFTHAGGILFLWFSKLSHAILFKTTFGGRQF